MRYRVPLLLCALLVLSVTVGVAPVAGQPQPGETHLEAQLQDNGDADWSVTVVIPIEDEEDQADFEAFATGFESETNDLDLGVDAFEHAAEEAAAESGREMEIHSIRRESEIVNETEGGEVISRRGLLRVSFTWESFARIEEDDTLYVDDAFNTTDGTWLPGLAGEQSLTIRSPPGYGGPTTSPIGAEAGDLHWEGPTTFEPGYFSIVYPPGTSTPWGGDGLSTALVAGALVSSGSALLVGVYILLARRRDGDTSDGPLSPDAPVETRSTPNASVGSENANGDHAEGADIESEPPESAEQTPNRDIDLLSDEERVERLLERSGGRMKQATIVQETGWSNAKVSQLLSAMDENDRVHKLRIGRENLISLPGEGVGDIQRDEEEP